MAIGPRGMTGKPDDARVAAVDALCEWETRRLPMDRVFAERAARLDPRDRRLARTIVSGALRHLDELDAALAEFSRHPLKDMEPRLRMCLRAGVFQLGHLTRIPASAAVNGTVNTLKRGRFPSWLVGFANGVLRRTATERDRLSRFAVDSQGRPLTNHPAWLCERWAARFGEKTMRAVCGLNNTEPALALRVNTRKNGRQDFLARLLKSGIRARAGRLSPVGLVVEGYPGPIPTLFGYEVGFFQVQDEAAQLVGQLFAGLSGPVRALDACAGPGGKTGHLAEVLPPGSRVIALEPETNRFRLLLENMNRLGHLARPDGQGGGMVEALRDSLSRFASRHPEPFDAILVDAPCSGTGVIRRRPDIRWTCRPEDLPRHAALQESLLKHAAALLKPEGLLVYATCSLEPEENDEVVTRFLAAHPKFRLETAAARLPEAARNLVRENGCFAPLPTDGCDGFFAACLRRNGEAPNGIQDAAADRFTPLPRKRPSPASPHTGRR